MNIRWSKLGSGSAASQTSFSWPHFSGPVGFVLRLTMLLFLLAIPFSASGLRADDSVYGSEQPSYSADEPEIVIRKGTEGEVYYDYVVNGEVKEIKVVPSIGKPYYLVPAKGHDGYIRLDRSQLLIPKWVLFRW